MGQEDTLRCADTAYQTACSQLLSPVASSCSVLWTISRVLRTGTEVTQCNCVAILMRQRRRLVTLVIVASLGYLCLLPNREAQMQHATYVAERAANVERDASLRAVEHAPSELQHARGLKYVAICVPTHSISAWRSVNGTTRYSFGAATYDNNII
jgi:hypothetical protein|eukprot:COSAG01_NODE_6454_length_3659_cov_3.918258_3_plen_155_part_00